MKNRSDIEVMASILRSATSSWEYKTSIMNTAAISHSQLIRYLAVGIEKGLIEYSETTGLYKTTKSGVFYLRKYEQMVSMLPSVPEILDFETESSSQKSRDHLYNNVS
jgi:predicted transcriptional regulator